MSQTILITAGGTGGHVMPALALQHKLETQGHKVILLTDARGYQYIPEDRRQQCIVLPLPRYQGNLLIKLRFALALLNCIVKCWTMFRQSSATTIVGFGGYVTLPPLLVAIIRRTRIILHEQNAVLGRVNRLIGRIAYKIAVSTPTLVNCPDALRQKLVTTGLPIRSEIEQLRQKWCAIKTNKLNILVIGGSQAAQFFGEIIPKTLAYLPENLQKQIRIHHQCRLEDQALVHAAYAALKINFQLAAFFKDMVTELEEADLIFARAGASTIAEISIVGKAAYFIPLPHAMDDHQANNAQLATLYGGGWWQRQQSVQPEALAHFIQYVLNYPQVLQFEAEKLRGYGQPSAAARLAEVVKRV